ncbi:asparagine synthase (glutamine-hydrolyzing) [Desertivirga xinjiangensis]|uniref:asparagine synthase (glutamine-hydrolyzing) n=1 Tax=Desertivirga xinjiangensis TaxID=539206 RepID=UPI0021093ABA|nr:asparagine synthase (glutamine-hydrolyzing) [Pedobacter xinjiangensis]
MCGIFGSTIKYNEAILAEKLDKINFRGPDYSGSLYIDDLVLGHNRLAIIDLDHRSDQPFSYLHLHIVFNGEIYNYQDIKSDLVKKGYRFTTAADTEVICAAFLEYGRACVNYFNGMFAFVIYDSQKKTLFGGRDRLGKKPLYYSLAGGEFEFASQPSQITLARNFTLDTQAIYEYLKWGYIPEPRSVWTQIRKVPAGHTFTYSLTNRSFETEKYWDLDYSWKKRFTGDYGKAKHILNNLLFDAVKLRMHADVPLGVFLSGGIDSSLVATVATKIVSNVKTFSMKFNEKGFDESIHAAKVANCLGTDHHTIECNYSQAMDLIRNFSLYYDEPFADSSAIPSMLLSKHTKQHVTVALSGDGGDEVFLGYERYKWIRSRNYLFRSPQFVRKYISSLISLSPLYKHKLVAKAINIENIQSLYVKMFGGLDNSWIDMPKCGADGPFIHLLSNSNKPLMETVSDFDIKTYLNDDINTKVDRASMAFSLEARSPLMDYRIIEFGRSLPTSFKYKGNIQKRILKDILFEHLSARLFDRPKAGFTMPFAEWFRNELKEYVLDNLSAAKLKQIPGINIRRSQEIINEHMTGKWNRYPQIWKLLVLSQWLNNQNKTEHFHRISLNAVGSLKDRSPGSTD